MAAGFSLKDQLFNADKVQYLAGLFAEADPGFASGAFQNDVMARLPALELKQRIALIAECLGTHLPGELPQIAPVLRAALPPPLDPERTDDDFGDFIFAPLGDLVVARSQTHPELALDLIEDITQRFSMEWAVRPLIGTWPDLVLDRMGDWATHDSYHVRRLVSEGTRPRLPWGQGIALHHTVPLPLLDVLHADRTRYVTRSVANHLNDIAKADPDLVMDRLAAWTDQAVQSPQELDWMRRHALRSLVKAGNARAMQVLGYDPQADLRCDLSVQDHRVAIGGTVAFACSIDAATDTPVLVDYRIWFAKPDGSERAKVFKLKQGVARAGKTLELRKVHRMKGDATTFRLHPGPHRIEILVNGRERGQIAFDLTAA